MPRAFVLPDLGEGLTEAEIVKVLVKEGDLVGEDTPLLEVETDKAQVEIPSPLSGRVLTIHVEPHQTVKVGAVLVTFADAEESTSPAARNPGPRRPLPPRGLQPRPYRPRRPNHIGGRYPPPPPRGVWPVSFASISASYVAQVPVGA